MGSTASYSEWLDAHPEAVEKLAGSRHTRSLLSALEQRYYKFQPRPDNPGMYDEQTSFVESQTTGVAWHIGGNGSGTTTAALYKVARFVLERQPPPRRDTPFWIISDTYENCMRVAWKKIFHEEGFLPRSEVDYERIVWYNSKQDYPYLVPLLPWPGRPGANWQLEFKSYIQGRSKFQSEAVGGFCFIEQFPYVLLTEVLRGCREYNFPGSKICEFTPIDPALSIEIEQMIADSTLPPRWEVWRSNTLCNAENLAPEWLEEFLASVPSEMIDTRTTGAFAVYEGTIYGGFNPAIHVVGDDVITHPPGCYYGRGIDWGASREHPFACVWGYRDGTGSWYIYDEYLDGRSDRVTGDYADAVKDQHPKPIGEGVDEFQATYADPSRPNEINAFNAAGIYTSSAANAVNDGINWIRLLLQFQTAGTNGDRHLSRRPMLFIHKRCKRLIQQMRSYRWKRGSDRGLNPAAPPAQPLKRNDDLVDALRYLLYSERAYSTKPPERAAQKWPSVKRFGVQLEGR